MEDIILVGFGGHAKSIADTIERQKKYRIVGYTDIEIHVSKYKYLGNDDILQKYYENGVKNAFICIGYLGKGNLRQKLYEKLKNIGYTLPVISDPSAIISDTAIIGEGTFVGKGAIINAEAQIGKMSIINSSSLVEHECIIADYCHVAVGAILCGQVVLGTGVFIGASATIIQTVVIGKYSIVGAGAVVIQNIPEYSRTLGNPAKTSCICNQLCMQ